MKKFLSWMLAVLMLAMPVIGLAESALMGSDLMGNLSAVSFSQKYLAEGQRQVTDIRMNLTDEFYQMLSLPDEFATPVKDLLKVMTIEVSEQATDNMMQAALRLLMDKEGETEPAVAADITMALGDNGLYANSSFLGNKPVQVTNEQLNQLTNQMMDQLLAQMVEEGVLTQEQADKLKEDIANFSKDPMALLQSLFGTPDFTNVMIAALGLVETSQPAEVTEKPEEVPFDAKYVMNVTVKRDAMKEVTTELAKVLWSMPVVRMLVGQDVTEEKLIAGLNTIPDGLAEDIAAEIYMTEDGKDMMIISEIKFKADDDRIQPVKFTVLMETKEDGARIAVTADLQNEDDGMFFSYDITMKGTEKSFTMDMEMAADVTSSGETYRMMEEVYHVTSTMEETARTLNMDVTMRMRTDETSDPIAVVYNITDEEKDLGDHAEETAKATIGIEGVGTLMTMDITGKTDLAEAYIITEDTVRPMDSEDAMNEFMNSMMNNVTSGLLQLMNAVPQSVQQLMVQIMNSAAK